MTHLSNARDGVKSENSLTGTIQSCLVCLFLLLEVHSDVEFKLNTKNKTKKVFPPKSDIILKAGR